MGSSPIGRSMQDFTEEMQLNDNDKVNELCGCGASRLTYSRRTDRSHHETWCDYRLHIEDRVRRLISELQLPGSEIKRLMLRCGV